MTSPFRVQADAGRGWRQQVEDNSGKFAQAYGFFTSTGAGQVVMEDVIDFGAIFIEPPTVAHGYALTDVSVQLVDGSFPKAWGGIHEWVRDKDDFYIGAYAFLVVETISPYSYATDPGYELDHFFTFSGIALKKLPPELFEE